MPHISVKILKGRTEAQKQKLAAALTQALQDSLNASREHISLTIEDYTAEEWQGIFAEEITSKKNCLYVEPNYNPEDLL